MPTHYEALGVDLHATRDEVRQAYLARARELHPDRAGHTADARRMQEVNEAWRVLGDPGRRAAYDAALATSRPANAVEPPSPQVDPLDVPYRGPAAEPGDLVVAFVRMLPWMAIGFVLAAIFVFTAFAGSDGDEEEPPPAGVIVDEASQCPRGTTATPRPNSRWECIR